MSTFVDLNLEEVKVLLSGLHNLVIDKELIDYLQSQNSNAINTIENLICKFEDTFKR